MAAALTPLDDNAGDWPARTAGLALAGAGIGVVINFLLDDGKPYQWTDDVTRLALAAFLATGGIAFGFVVVRAGHLAAAAFALAAAAVVAGVVYWNGLPSVVHSGDGWRLFCSLLAVAIAAPLFQAWRGAGSGGGISYTAAHRFAWFDVVLWFASWAFVGIAIALAYLLSDLFSLIGLKFLHDLLAKPWFFNLLVGLAFGGTVGLLRDRERILGTLQRVVTTVLSVLAPVLATGLVTFLAALPFTGLTPLWGATKSTTPILLACIFGALVLANAVIGDAADETSKGRPLRWAAMALGAAILPLAVIAAVSTGFRIDQHGLTPDRLWAVVFTGVACGYGLAYLVVLARHRARWAEAVRVANLRLALTLCGVAFVLSTPLFSFGAIATRDQLARLDSGRTPADTFDWSAMRFDFGPAGKAAVAREARSAARPEIRAAAAAALKAASPWVATTLVSQANSERSLDHRLTVLPVRIALPADLRHRLTEDDACGVDGVCAIIYTPGAREVFVAHACAAADAAAAAGDDPVDLVAPSYCSVRTARLTTTGDGWRDDDGSSQRAGSAAEIKTRTAAARAELLRRNDDIRHGAVEVRDVRRRQVFVGGMPVGNVFDPAP